MQIDYVSARKRSVRTQTKCTQTKPAINVPARIFAGTNQHTHAHAHLSANSGQIFYTFMVVQQPQQPPPPTDRPTVCQSSKYAAPPDDVLGASATCAKACRLQFTRQPGERVVTSPARRVRAISFLFFFPRCIVFAALIRTRLYYNSWALHARRTRAGLHVCVLASKSSARLTPLITCTAQLRCMRAARTPAMYFRYALSAQWKFSSTIRVGRRDGIVVSAATTLNLICVDRRFVENR